MKQYKLNIHLFTRNDKNNKLNVKLIVDSPQLTRVPYTLLIVNHVLLQMRQATKHKHLKQTLDLKLKIDKVLEQVIFAVVQLVVK